MEDLYLYPFRPSAWIRVSGEDARDFLQGQFSNDLNRNEERPVTYGLWLDAKGKIQGDSFVLGCGEETFYLFSYHTAAAVLTERLDRYIIADDVEVADETDTVCGFGVWGGPAGAFLEAAGFPVPAPGEFAPVESGGRIIRGMRSAEESYEVLLPVERGTEEGKRLEAELLPMGGAIADAERCHYERIRSGIPAVMIDVGPGNLPQEAGLESRAVSCEKGCYTGQEVMARLRNKGRVRRRLVRVGAEGFPSAVPCPVFDGDRRVGEITSYGRCGDDQIGFALVEAAAAEGGRGLSLEPDAGRCIRILDSENGRKS